MDDDYDDQLLGAGCEETLAAERKRTRRSYPRKRVRAGKQPTRGLAA